VQALGDWRVLQTAFGGGGRSPGIFLFRVGDEGPNLVGVAWTGNAPPDHAAMRASIAERYPQLPPELVPCLDLSRWQ
jgi:hypothetical protein